MKIRYSCLFFALSLMLSLTLPAAGVEIAVNPDPVLIAPGDGTQNLNFDFLVRNTGEETLAILSVRLTVFDAGGALVTRREINRMGMRPSIATLGVTEFAPGAMTVLLNPFQEFSVRMPLASLRYELEFTPKESEGEIRSAVTVRPRPFGPKTVLRLPLDGKVLIGDGNDFYAHHRRVDLGHPLLVQMGMKHNPTRHGMDFIVADPDGKTYKNDGKLLEDYFVFGRPVLAPAAGVVADCIDGRPDNKIGEFGIDYDELMRTKNGRLLGGNYVVLDHGNGEVSFFAHMQKGSVKVQKGDRIKAGQVLGLVGNSGDSFWPHLHYQLQSGTGFDEESLPAVFHDFRRYYGSKAEKIKSGTVNTGDLVESR